MESSLPLHDLIDLLTEQKKTGTLEATFMLQQRAFRGRCIAQVQMKEGIIQSCLLSNQELGMKIEGQQALNLLYQLRQEITWTLGFGSAESREPTPFDRSENKNAPLSASFAPRKVRNLTLEESLMLSRKNINVFQLIDGKRSIWKIAQLRNLRSEEAEAILHDLRNHGLVE
ncbi:hypothetical protein [Reticulibacter mediterranei]|nr:hypothetical protein [Reticulibacter mediterranei]